MNKQLQKAVLELEPVDKYREHLWSRILSDLDAASDYRLIRLDKALAGPSVYLYVVFFGFLLTMARFGAYRPQAPLVVLVSTYTLYAGLVLYLILALSDPFQGDLGGFPTTFEHLIDGMRAELS